MGKLEKEIKILDINVEDTINKLNEIGAEFKNVKNQKIYTYDIPTMYYRYIEAMELVKSDNELLVKTSLKKLAIIFDEVEDLIDDKKLTKIYSELGVSNFEELLSLDSKDIVLKLTESKTFNKEIKNQLINPNKWVRLRQSNDSVELTVKHIYDKDDTSIQKVGEYEVKVSDLNETNQILEQVGIVRRNYQEKIRHSFTYKDAEIEIDEWPMLKPYMEIECDNLDIIDEVVEKLGYKDKEIVSLNTEQLYKRINIDILKMSDLKF